MSFVITLKPSQPIKLADVLSQLPAGSTVHGDIEENELLLNSKFILPGKSTRGIRAAWDNNEYTITINVLASPADHRLAIEIAKAISAATGVPIIPEDNEALSPEAFAGIYNDEWIGNTCTSGIGVLKHIAETSDSAAGIAGYNYSFYTGRRLLKELDAANISERELYDKLTGKMIALQLLDTEKYYIPNIFEVKEKANGKGWTFTVLGLESAQLVRSADYLVVPTGENSRMRIPFDKLDVLHDHAKFTLIDECQMLCEKLTKEEAAGIMQLLSPYDGLEKKEPNEPLAAATKNEKKWWQFWK